MNNNILDFLTAGGSAAGRGIWDFLSGGNSADPMKEANKYYGQIPGAMKPYYDPYIQAGQRQLPGMENSFNEMMANPGDIISRMGAGYQKSPGYDFRLNEAERAATNAAAAGGMAGAPQHQQYASQIAHDMANQDYENYLQKTLGLYGAGLSGKQGLFNTGYNASSSLSDNLANLLARQGDMAYKGALDKNQGNRDMWSNIFGLGKTALSFL